MVSYCLINTSDRSICTCKQEEYVCTGYYTKCATVVTWILKHGKIYLEPAVRGNKT